MDIEIRHLRRGAGGAVNTQTERHSGPELSIGRASHHGLHLPDPRLLLNHAVIREKAGQPWFHTDAPDITRVAGETVSEIALTPGLVLALGPYEMTVLAPEPGLDLIVTMELVVPLDDAARVMRRTHDEAMDKSARWLAWISVFSIVSVLGLAFFWPLGIELSSERSTPGAATWERAQLTDRTAWDIRHIWTVGALSRSHGFMEQQCEACHTKAFTGVPEESCAVCHTDIAHHADPDDLTMPDIQDTACGACHREHDPAGTIVNGSQAFCADCHAGDALKQAGVTLDPARDFGLGHPSFKPRVAIDARELKFARLPLTRPGGVKQDTSFRFPHHVHLTKQANTQLGPDAERVLACGDCHVPEEDGPRMRPVDMEKHCRECHKLEFKSGTASRPLPHGDPYGVQLVVSDIIRQAEIEQTRLRLKYSPKPPDPKNLLADLEDRVAGKVENSLGVVFANTCGTCHTVRAGGTDDARKFHIDPVIIPDHWMVKARFDHRGHETIPCLQCHQAKTSTKAQDLLLPTLRTCQGCHGGEAATNKVRSTCIMCHRFHLPGHPSMAEQDLSAAPG